METAEWDGLDDVVFLLVLKGLILGWIDCPVGAGRVPSNCLNKEKDDS